MTEFSNESPDLIRRRGIRNTVIVLVIIIITVIGLIVHKVTKPRILNPEELHTQGAVLFDKPRRFSDIELIDHKGHSFKRDQLQGKWSLIYFGFTQCPDICPMTMLDLSRLLPMLPEDIAANTQVILVSLDPARDTPEKLAEYVPYFHPDFIGVTGEFLAIRRFANELNVAFAKVTQGDDYTIDHSGNIILINPQGDYHAFFKPPFDNEKLSSSYASIYRLFKFN